MIRITMKDGGVIDIALDAKAAPITVENFEKLVKDHFYDGLIFHRVIPGFMIQGGDPQGTGMGGPGWHIKGEFAANGWDNPIRHERGVISMARAQNPDSAGSQFFIMHADADYLDGQYAAFGKVVSGMDVVDKIASVPTLRWNNRPLTDQGDRYDPDRRGIRRDLRGAAQGNDSWGGALSHFHHKVLRKTNYTIL